jgi:xanthine dehydrogenase YagR molybdenum-binding subunit
MMEPHATIAVWENERLTLWTANQMIAWSVGEVATTLGLPRENVRVVSPFIGGGFGGKLFVRADALMAALGARAAGRPVKVALTRPQSLNNTTHRPATIQRIRLGATPDGQLTAIAHESWSGDLKGGGPEAAVAPTRLLYAGANRFTALNLAVLDLPEGNAMRAPGEAPGLMALEIAMDEMAEKLGLDPVECLRQGAARFGWDRRNPKPGQVREGRWLVGLGVAAAIRNSLAMKSAARVRLDGTGRVTIETDMTDIGTGTYTILAQTAAEMMGLPLEQVSVRLGDSRFPVSCGSGGQWGATNSTSGVYAACVKLREQVAAKLGLDPKASEFAGGFVQAGDHRYPLGAAAATGNLVAEDGIEYGELA